jgi:hypothetical protein
MNKWHAVAGRVMNIEFQRNAGNFLSIPVTLSFSRSLLHVVSH